MSQLLKLASTSASLFFSYLFLGGHVQNATLGDAWVGAGRAARVHRVALDPRTGAPDVACHGEACHDDCDWWVDEIGNRTDVECNDYNLRRVMSVRQLTDALARAQACADRATETCVLSHEVGLRAPAALVYNASEQRMRLYLLPRITPVAAGDSASRRVALFPVGTPPGGWSAMARHAVVPMHDEVLVEHYDAWQHEVRRDVVRDEAAYCLQLLLRSVPDECAVGGELPLEGDPDGRL